VISLVHMRRNSVNSASGRKTALTIVFTVQRPRFLIKGLNLWRFDNTIIEFYAYFNCTCTKTAT